MGGQSSALGSRSKHPAIGLQVSARLLSQVALISASRTFVRESTMKGALQPRSGACWMQNITLPAQ